LVEELTVEGFEDRPKTNNYAEAQDNTFSIMQEATTVPRDRRRMNRRQSHRRARPAASAQESRKTYRRDLFDRRGMQFICKTSATCSDALAYLEKFGSHWNLTGLDRLDVRASVLNESHWCLDWHLNVDHISVAWRASATQLADSSTFTLQPLGGDLEVFDGRVWVTPLPHGSQIHFNLIAAFGLGSFERLVGNIFRLRCEKIFRALLLKWKNDLDHLS
jgi:hypothetical protein